MCLITHSSALSKAEKPIKCYKVLIKGYGDECLTPIQKTPVPKSILLGIKTFKAEGIGILRPANWYYYATWGFEYVAEKGFIHCFKTLDGAAEAAKPRFRCEKKYRFEIWEVEIPAGTEYVEGFYRYSLMGDTSLDMLECVAAREIRYVKPMSGK